MKINSFYDAVTATFTYLVVDEDSKQCAIIDPVLNYQADSGRTSTESADHLLSIIQSQGLKVQWILETHIHADHLTAASYLKQHTQAPIGIGSAIIKVLDYWVPLFNTQHDTPMDGSQFDHLFKDAEEFTIGSLKAKVMHTPGHTPACITYLIEDAAFVGDTIFMPYMGTSRADFPGGDAETLYHSIQKILALPPSTRLHTGHDYPPKDHDPRCESTVMEQKATNFMINDSMSKEDYIQKRTQRDKTLSVPKLLLPSIQMNLRAGAKGREESNGIHYVKIPLDVI